MTAARGRIDRWLPRALVLVACAWVAVAYRSELTVPAAEVNDAVFHLGLVDRANAAWESGGNPRDPFVPYWGLGFPVLRYYQHLPHLTVVALHRLSLKSIPLVTVYHAVLLLALALMPLSFYWGSRWLGFARHTSALAAVCAPLVAVEPGQRLLLGLQVQSFVWLGGGMFTQLFAMVFFAPALGMVHRAVLTGRHYGPALALLWATWLSHLLLGYIVCLLGIAVLARPEASGLRRVFVLRLAGLYAAAAFSALYLLLPTIMEARFLGRTVWEDAAYWDSFGAGPVLAMLARGALLDGSRLPVLTLCAAAGVIVALVRNPGHAEGGATRTSLLAFVLALLVYFGRPFWGRLLDLLPMSDSFPLHRFVCGVQYGAVLLAAMALGAAWNRLGWERSPARAAAAVVGTLLVLGPAIASVARFAGQNATLRAESALDLARNRAGLDEMLDRFAALDRELPGRAYAGASWNWGRDYKLAFAPVYLFWSSRGLPSISYMFHGMSLNSDLEPHFDDRRRDHYDLFNVRWWMAPNRGFLPDFARVIGERPGIVAAAVETRGFFDVVGVGGTIDPTAMTGPEGYDFRRRFVESTWHSAGRFVRISDRPEPGETVLGAREVFPPGPYSRPEGAVLKSWGSNDQFGADVEVGHGAWVLFRMTYHPGWRARVDGQPVETAMLAPSFIGIPMTSGRHRIDLAYQPAAWTTGLFWLGLLGPAAGFALDRRRP